jgi:6-phosphofructokinase 1
LLSSIGWEASDARHATARRRKSRGPISLHNAIWSEEVCSIWYKERAIKAVQIERFGAPEVLEVAEVSSPEPQGDEISASLWHPARSGVHHYWRHVRAERRLHMRVAVLTSGGDAPGMNAAVRAVARTAFFLGWEVTRVEAGYKGLLEGQILPMDRRRLGGIVQRGGTLLGTQRSEEFQTPGGQERAIRRLEEAQVDALVVIGGEGSLTGALKLSELGMKVVGIPATIDNDVWGTEIAIGVDTALNTTLETIDRIRDTASSHNRAHIVEVMGRHCGYLALMSAIAGGAEAVLLPEFEPNPDDLLEFIRKAYEQGKSHFVVVAAEGSTLSAAEFHEYVNSTQTYESRLTVIGHAQRGGIPTAFDRILGSRMGTAAIEALSDDEHGTMMTLRGELMGRLPLREVVGRPRTLDAQMYRMAGVLSALPE